MISLKSSIPLVPSVFHNIDSYYVILNSELRARSKLQLSPLDIECSFDVFELSNNKGFAFKSALFTENYGSVLISRLKHKKQESSHRIVIRSPGLVLVDYPGFGSVAMSPTLNPNLQEMFTEQ